MTNLNRRVFGYHFGNLPQAASSYRFDLLSTIGYAGYAVNAANGMYDGDVSGWRQTDIIGKAHAGGSRVVLVAQLFGAQKCRELLSNKASRTTLVTQLLALVKEQGADGVQLDLEQVPTDQRANMSLLVTSLSQAFRDVNPDYEVSAALPALDHSAFDLGVFATACDYVVVMAYDYAWSTAPNAGAVAPLPSITASINRYLQ